MQACSCAAELLSRAVKDIKHMPSHIHSSQLYSFRFRLVHVQPSYHENQAYIVSYLRFWINFEPFQLRL